MTKTCANSTVAFLLVLAAATGVRAQDYPAKPIALIMPFAAGGPGDTMARHLGTAMSAALKQQIVVENPSGAGGTIGINKVAKSRPDGYTLLIMNIGMSTAPTLYRNLPYNVIDDFDHIGRVADVPMVIVGKKGLAPGNFRELLAHIRAEKQKVTLGHAGPGSASHLCALLFTNAIQQELTLVAYKGTAPALKDVVGGHIDLLCDQTTVTTPQVKAGMVKVYGVSSKERVSLLPEVPTFDEQGLANFEVLVWFALWAPKGLPKPVFDKLVTGLQSAVVDPAFKAKVNDFGGEPVPVAKANPEALRSFFQAEIDKWRPIIQKAGVYAD